MKVGKLAVEDIALSWRAWFTVKKELEPGKTGYRIENKVVSVSDLTQSAVCDKDGRYTTVFAAAVFLFQVGPRGRGG